MSTGDPSVETESEGKISESGSGASSSISIVEDDVVRAMWASNHTIHLRNAVGLVNAYCKDYMPGAANLENITEGGLPLATAVEHSKVSQQSDRKPAINAMRLTAKRRAKDNPRSPSSSESAGSTTDIECELDVSYSIEGYASGEGRHHHSEYEDVFRLLTENPPEQILDVHFPYSKGSEVLTYKLSDFADFWYYRYPYLEYNSLTETVTVVTVPNSIHEVAHASELLDHVLPLGSTTKKDFDGDYAKSSRQADGGIEYSPIDGACVRIAIEVGISQSYKSLCDAKDMWINGHHI
ncbi:hypothetical protein V1520DRAFT_328204 [Lipomyces starkeyi]